MFTALAAKPAEDWSLYAIAVEMGYFSSCCVTVASSRRCYTSGISARAVNGGKIPILQSLEALTLCLSTTVGCPASGRGPKAWGGTAEGSLTSVVWDKVWAGGIS